VQSVAPKGHADLPSPATPEAVLRAVEALQASA